MGNQVNATLECNVIGQFTDRGKPEASEPKSQSPTSEVSHTHLLGEFVDRDRHVTPPLLHFIVLLKDSKVFRVRGHSIESGPGNSRQIVRFTAGKTICVAMFESSELVGIYEGDKLPA
jgi:hypothetical protein